MIDVNLALSTFQLILQIDLALVTAMTDEQKRAFVDRHNARAERFEAFVEWLRSPIAALKVDDQKEGR